jgi:hypothetical protein
VVRPRSEYERFGERRRKDSLVSASAIEPREPAGLRGAAAELPRTVSQFRMALVPGSVGKWTVVRMVRIRHKVTSRWRTAAASGAIAA